MSETSAPEPQLYLNTPYLFDPEAFSEALSRALDAARVSCVRLRLRGASEDELKFAIDAVRPVCHSREVALIISDFYELVGPCGLDGVHFEVGQNAQVEARKVLGPDAIIGVGCGVSRHQGMLAGERGADYVSFHPVAQDGPRAGDVATRGLYEWWQNLIEIPVVAEGSMTPARAAQLVGAVDFIGVGRSVWRHPDGPAAAMRDYTDAIAAAYRGLAA